MGIQHAVQQIFTLPAEANRGWLAADFLQKMYERIARGQARQTREQVVGNACGMSQPARRTLHARANGNGAGRLQHLAG